MTTWYPCYIKKQFEIDALYTAFERFADNNFNFKGESHGFYELVCVVSGSVGVAAGDKIYTLERGDIAIHPPYQFHRIWSNPDTSPHFIIISFSARTQFALDGVYATENTTFNSLMGVFRAVMGNCMFEKEQITQIINGRELAIQKAVKTLENIICDILENPKNALEQSDISRTAVRYSQIINCLEENYNMTLTVPQIAKLCNISESALKQTFKKYSGIGVMEYFNNVKVKYAIGMLYKGSTIKEVSKALGFCDPNYFSTVFKRVTGVSPKNYINMKISGENPKRYANNIIDTEI
ncbi:MAG: helix-turn-helix transcriptional regulator [Clostridia bacterium]|nr:helix-turn-helix transcriptional regulator [Clostridia bacterium]